MATAIEIFKAAVKASIGDKTAEGSIINTDIAQRFYDAVDLMLSLNALGSIGFKGVATPTTNPGSAVGGRMWVTSTAGTYTYFSGIVINANEVAFLVDSGSNYVKVLIPIDSSNYLTPSSVIDNLTSTSTTAPLSANQGKVLADLIPALGKIAGKNMFNLAAVTSGYIIQYSNGALVANTNGAVSDYMPVTAGSIYTISGRITSSGTRGVAFYDGAKTLINTPSGSTTWGDGALNGQYTAPTGAAYMRITTKYSGTGDNSVIQVEAGSTATTYEAYYTVVNTLATLNMAPSLIQTELGTMTPLAYLAAKGYATVTVQELPGTINLFDRTKIISGYHINYTNGALAATSGSQVTGLIPVKPSTTYYISGRASSSGTRGVRYFDANGVFINTPTGTSTWGDGPLNGTYTTTADTHYIQFTIAFSTVASSGVEQIEAGTSPSAYIAYSGYNAIAKVNGSAVQADDTATLAKVDVKINATKKWYGKKICWMGTSIPANYPNTDITTSYPNLAAKALGATIINESKASSLVRIATSTGGALATNFQQVCFGMTGAELTAAQGSTYAVNSYETKMLGHLDADLFVFDFGYNDYSADNTSFSTFPTDPRDRNTFIGSMNYCITMLLQAKPKARFAIFGHYENVYRFPISQAQQSIADYWGCYIFKTWERTGWSQRYAPGTGLTILNNWLPDNIHPGADTTGQATALLANLAQSFLMGL
ncbi:hypothetical protein [Chitinophaga sp. LS1]|uniref:hypothetical protein n=1 Tax=Chitinophaga sp. LS1 TaxID=3051176 RepID=UPI002AABB1AC|nr:hypothetical protein [Chitinophaga sp. LS1]WPV66273.1 hypothetical protein QQL36_31235 [Chitinophaga sp. LS1]